MINNLTNLETIILFLLFLLLLVPLRLISRFNKLSFFNPLIFFSLFMSYYCFFSPIYRVFTNGTIDRGIQFRDVLIYGWIGSILLILSTYFGYFSTQLKSLKKYRVCNLNTFQLWKIGFWINNIGIIAFLISVGLNPSKFNPFTNYSVSSDIFKYSGNFQNYLSFAQDFLISGNILMVSSLIRNKNKFFITIFYLILTIGLYLNTGFRYKLFCLTFPIFLLYFLLKKFRKKIYFLYTTLGILFFSFSYSLIEIIRTYGKGFDLEKLEKFNFSDIFLNIIQSAESTVFLTTSGVISIVPSKFSYIYFYPLYKILIHPIPSSFFKKDAGDYVNNVLLELYQIKSFAVGAAFHNFGEYYLMFGWLGIIIGGYILGFLLKRLWIWVIIHKDEEIAYPLYLLNTSFLFIIISRGYLPQQVQLYAFSVLPLTLTYILNMKKIKTKNI